MRPGAGPALRLRAERPGRRRAQDLAGGAGLAAGRRRAVDSPGARRSGDRALDHGGQRHRPGDRRGAADGGFPAPGRGHRRWFTDRAARHQPDFRRPRIPARRQRRSGAGASVDRRSPGDQPARQGSSTRGAARHPQRQRHRQGACAAGRSAGEHRRQAGQRPGADARRHGRRGRPSRRRGADHRRQ